MTIEELKLHWQYFLAIDEEFEATDRYVDHDIANLDTYSIEFSKLLILICNEFEMMCRLIYKHYVKRFDLASKISIFNLSQRIVAKYPYIRRVEVYTVLNDKITPLGDWCIKQDDGKYKLNLSWWTDYNDVKHNRHENFKKANLRNVINAIASLYALFIYMAFLLRNEHSKGHPVLELQTTKSVSCSYKSIPLIAAPNELPCGFERFVCQHSKD